MKYRSMGSVASVVPCGSNAVGASLDAAKSTQPGCGAPTQMREKLPVIDANLGTCTAPTTTCFTSPRSMRSRRSSGVSSAVAGISTAPSLMAASIVSHSALSLPSTMSTRSPRCTPCARRKLATWLERCASCANENRSSVPSASTIHSAVASLPFAMTSKWSSAQLNAVSAGQRNCALAAAGSPRRASS
ncbi:hypothetical protein FQZ97_1006010 [compost metagenome]